MVKFIIRTFLSVAALFVVALIVFSLWDRTLKVLETRARATHAETSRRLVPDSVERTGWLPVHLQESSGVAVSRTHTGVLWSHNDSGDGPVIYAIDMAGRVLGTYRVAGVNAVDWEDIDLGPCPDTLSTRDCLYVGDVGDNSMRRPTYQILIIPEPDPAPTDASTITLVDDVRRLEFTYVDGPHDSEALAVSGDGDIYVVTKGLDGRVRLFRISAETVKTAVASRSRATAQLTMTLPIEAHAAIGRMVTGAAISPSGSTLAVRSYTEVYFFALRSDGTVTPAGSPCYLGALEPQGEAVDFLDEQTLVLTSETARGRRGTIHRVRCAGGNRAGQA